nr:response regulator [uncultured Butyrivibrio sp.]
MLRIAIVEDEKEYQASLVEYLSRYEKDHNDSFIVRTFYDGIDILDDYTSDYDLIFLDIHMKHQDGMTTAKKIRHLLFLMMVRSGKCLSVIFITSR